MKLNRHNREFLERQSNQSHTARRNAAERFRNEHVDSALKRALNAIYNEEITLDSHTATPGKSAPIDPGGYYRRVQQLRWMEDYEQLQAIKPRTPDEAVAKCQALDRLLNARPA